MNDSKKILALMLGAVLGFGAVATVSRNLRDDSKDETPTIEQEGAEYSYFLEYREFHFADEDFNRNGQPYSGVAHIAYETNLDVYLAIPYVFADNDYSNFDTSATLLLDYQGYALTEDLRMTIENPTSFLEANNLEFVDDVVSLNAEALVDVNGVIDEIGYSPMGESEYSYLRIVRELKE